MRTFLATSLIAFLLGGAFGIAAAAVQQPRLLFPIIANGEPVATVCSPSGTLLLDQDTGSLSAMRDAEGRYIVAYQDRAHGSVAHVAQHVGDHLEDLAAPVLLAALPAFSPTGVKQGSLALVPSAMPGGKSRLYYTQRKAGDDTGPYGVWCMEF